MEINKSTNYTVIDTSVNRVDGMIMGLGENETDAIHDFIKVATKMKKLSEENVHILDNLIEEATELIGK